MMQNTNTKRCEANTVLPQQHFVHLCPYNDAPCPWVEVYRDKHIAEREVPNDELKIFARQLPCHHCDVATEAQASGLRGVRLGKRERALLLAAPPPDAEEGMWVVATGGTIEKINLRAMTVFRLTAPPPRAAQEAELRAMRKLCDAGLLVARYARAQVLPPGSYRWRNTWLRRVWLTPFGAELVKRYRDELQTGKRIRWDKRTADAAESAAATPDEFVGHLNLNIGIEGERVERRLELVKLVAIMKGHDAPDPSENRKPYLEEVAEQLREFGATDLEMRWLSARVGET